MPFDSKLPFTWREGLDHGISQRALGGRAYRKLATGVYVDRNIRADPYVEARAALLIAGPVAFVSHHTAARLFGGIVPDVPVLHASVAPGCTRSSHRDVVVHQSRRTPVRFRGLPVTSPEDVFLDLATRLPLVDLVVLGDSLVRRERTTVERLVEAMHLAAGRGIRPARRAAALVRAGVDSPMETRSRMLRVLSGLPELETDIRFFDPSTGELLRRLDAGDRRTRTAVEYDGRHHADRRQQWESDLQRREEFENVQWRIVTIVSKDIYVTPSLTIERLARVFRQRGILVRSLRDDWRRHFPDRQRAA